jgi:hypothetical protein
MRRNLIRTLYVFPQYRGIYFRKVIGNGDGGHLEKFVGSFEIREEVVQSARVFWFFAVPPSSMAQK